MTTPDSQHTNHHQALADWGKKKMATHYVSLLTSVFFLSIFFFFLFPNRLVIYQLLLIKSARSTQKPLVDARSTQKPLVDVVTSTGGI